MSIRGVALFAVLASLASGARRSTYIGCFESPSELTYDNRFMFQSLGYCVTRCTASDTSVLGLTNGTTCFCGDGLPPWESVVEDALCNTPCTGYARDSCGGMGYFAVHFIEPEAPERPPNATSTQSRLAETAQRLPLAETGAQKHLGEAAHATVPPSQSSSGLRQGAASTQAADTTMTQEAAVLEPVPDISEEL